MPQEQMSYCRSMMMPIFSEGLAVVVKDGRWDIIEINGKTIFISGEKA